MDTGIVANAAETEEIAKLVKTFRTEKDGDKRDDILRQQIARCQEIAFGYGLPTLPRGQFYCVTRSGKIIK